MLLAMDIGNSSISIGVFHMNVETQDKDCVVTPEICFKLSTDVNRSADEYAFCLQSAFCLYGCDVGTIHAVMLATVVPNLTDVIRQGLLRITKAPVFLVGPGLKSGVNIRTDSPSELGADIVANAVGALSRVSSPIILVDAGTATSVFAIDAHKTILGGCIAPGLKIGLEALKEATSLLPTASLTLPENLIGKNTDDAVRSGVIRGHAMMLDGMIHAFSEQLGEKSAVIMTGGFAKVLLPAMQHTVQYAEHLTLEGIYRIYLLNSHKIHKEISY